MVELVSTISETVVSWIELCNIGVNLLGAIAEPLATVCGSIVEGIFGSAIGGIGGVCGSITEGIFGSAIGGIGGICGSIISAFPGMLGKA
ncbi:hypothetical protein [Candidatus Methanoliparum sp. LAM-1]|uniref:hypothetical protein n=1 Tax=Candidatus Methanoliparum sp. LAM-1 TaxID=2874846 RepID=UPI001E420FBB|nr:hypothetical protein [Candidatus Methanoliparum sp. LAM-1]BDC36290.1 hypothetical protein MTLP_09720 [Candidatus Methanoliparum sp. LAM-1]